MASSLHAESRRLYSWWWDSHISPKNSKWLQDNLTDMDSKVKAMIKLIEEDADSFARRAEMYYKKRPELMKMVEEFYRAYRALAERYDHATGALRQAHKTMAEAFPNQIPFVLTDESPSSSSGTEMEPHTPEMPAPVRAFFDSDDIQKDPLVISSHFHVIKRKGAYCEENDALTSRKGLKQLNEMIAAREGDAFSYLTEGRAKKVLNFQEEEGKNSENKTHYWARNLQNQESSEEEEYSQELSKLSKENQNLKSQIASESERADKAESEVQSLQDRLTRLNFEMEASIRKYQQSLERISDLETQISHTQDEFKNLNDEIVNGSMKLSSTEERGLLLEKRNQSLQSELDTIEQKTKTQQEELSKSLEESEKLSITIQDEHQQRMEAEMALLSMEKLYSQSQEELKTLALEVQRGIDKLKEMELTNLGLEEEICQLKEENASLNEQNLSSDLKIKDLRDEINILKETIGKVESDVGLHLEEKKVLQREFDCVKEDKHDLEQRHRGLTEEMEAVILNTESLQASVKELQDGNVELKEICKKHEDEKLVLLENLKNMEKTSEKNVVLELSLSDANVELEGLRGKIKTLEGSCESLHGQIITHISEKAVLVSQVETTAQNVEKLTEKNAFLENSLSDMNAELEGLRGKLKNLEESYQSLYDQKTNLLAEKNTLVSQVESISQSLNNLESKHAELEDKHLHLEREKDLTLHQVMELECFLKLQKQEHETLARSNKIQLATLGNQIRLLREERRVKEEEFEVEQQKVMSALFEIFILQRCLNDMKAKNLVLSKDCQKHLQASRCAEELVSQLEQNDLFQKEKITSLSEHNEKLREGILLLLRALNINKSFESTDGVKDEVLLQIILAEIKNLLNSISDSQDEIQHLQLEILFTVTTLKQIGLDVKDLRIENDLLEQELEIRKEELFVTQSKNQELLELNEHMRQEVQVRGESEEELKAQMETLIWQLSDSQEVQRSFKYKIHKLLEENHCLTAELYNLREEKDAVEEENSVLLAEATTLEHLYLLFRSSNAERALELKLCSDDMDCLRAVKSNIDQEIREMNGKMSVLELENMHLKKVAAYLDDYRHQLIISEFDLNTARYLREELNHQIETGKNLLIQKETELSEANQKVQSMQGKNQELLELNEHLRQDVHVRGQSGEELKAQMKTLIWQLSNLQEAQRTFKTEIQKLLEENHCLSAELYNLREEKDALEEENSVFIAEATTLDHLYLLFRSSNAERALELKFCSDDMDCLLAVGSNLDHEIREMNQKMSVLLVENMHLKESAAYLEEYRDHLIISEFDLNTASYVREELNHQIETGKNLLTQKEMELSKANQTVQSLQGKNQELLDLNEHLRQDVQVRGESEEELKAQMETLIWQLSDSQETQRTIKTEIHKFLEENHCLSAELQNLREEKDALEEENSVLLAEATMLEHLYLLFRSANAERALELKLCSDDMDCLRAVKSHLDQEIREMNKKMSVLQVEKNMHLKESAAYLEEYRNHLIISEFDLNTARYVREELNHQIETGKNLLTQKEMELSKANQKVQSLQGKNQELLELNEHLRQDMQVRGESEEELKAQMETLIWQLSDSQEAQRTFKTEIQKLLEENHCVSAKLHNLREEKDALEEENCVLVTEATTLEHLYLLFRSANAERALELKLCSDDMDCLCAVKSNLDQEITELNEKMSVLQVEKNMHLKESAAYLEEYRNHLIISEFDLNTARYICEELNHQIETGKNLLIQKEMELYEANQKVQSTHDINTELNRNLEGLNQDIDGAKMVREELENKIFSLSESIACRDQEIAHTTEANKMLYIKLENLNSKVEELQSREEHLTSNLQKGIVEIDQCGKDITTLLDDNQISTVSAAIFEEKVFELILGCESLEIIVMLQREMLNEEITSRNIFINELTKKHDEMEGENRGLKANLDAYLPLIMSLRDSIASVEERTLSLAGTHASNCQEKQDDSLVSHQHDKSTPLSEDHSTVVPVGLLELHKLIAKVEALQKMLTDAGSFLQQEIFDATANLEAARTEIEALKVKGSSVQEEEHVSKDIIMELIKKDEEPGTDHNRQKDDTEISKMKCEHKMKDIQLDEVLSSPPYVNGVGPYGLTRIENSGTDDQMLELWEAAERDCNTQMQQAPVIALEHDIEAIEEEKSEHPSSELVAEKELSIDSVEVPTEFEESRQEWNRNVIERLASDAERVSVLQRSVEELKRKMEDSEKSKRSKSLEYDTVRMKLKEAEGGILELIDINTELTKKAEEIGSTGRKQISERAQRGSEKIGSLELELQKIQYILLKLNEEHENNRTKSADRGPKIILREYIYGKREKLRKKKGSFCMCMRPKTKGD